jgi:predicted AAA+ superfamily ATPase
MALDDDVLVGRKTEKSKVIDLIGQPSDMEGCKVICVWGMGGLGKTTLVRSIYRSQQLGNWKRAWVTSPRPFNNEVLIRTLVLQLLTDDPTAASEIKQKKLDQVKTNLATMRLDDLREKLKNILEKHKNCLIVLDDLSSIEEWNLVRDHLAKAKRIIVTTREHKVAKHCSREDMNTHQLQVLEKDEALALFVKKVLLNILCQLFLLK